MKKSTEWLLALGVVVAAMFIAVEQKRQEPDMTIVILHTKNK